MSEYDQTVLTELISDMEVALKSHIEQLVHINQHDGWATEKRELPKKIAHLQEMITVFKSKVASS